MIDTFLKSSAASISSMKYKGVGLKWCSANTSDSEASVFSPPERFVICFQLFFGGLTLKLMPSLNGSSVSTSSSSASPPSVIIWYISFNFMEMMEKPSMNSSSRCCRIASSLRRDSSRWACTASYSPRRVLCSASALRKSSIDERFGLRFLRLTSSVSMRASTSARTTLSSSASSRFTVIARRASSRPTTASSSSGWVSASPRSSFRISSGNCSYSFRASCSLSLQALIFA
mmetsp:Transcript_93753/g.264718  ORF Transcript_93753/g.264718 Transcript_93753/m.264718 type:complete len:231 (-) Transcript_93753:3296-3988(-)